MSDKTCYCHTCKRWFHHMGIARHRAMHRDKAQNCEITFSDGETYRWHYAADSTDTEKGQR